MVGICSLYRGAEPGPVLKVLEFECDGPVTAEYRCGCFEQERFEDGVQAGSSNPGAGPVDTLFVVFRHFPQQVKAGLIFGFLVGRPFDRFAFDVSCFGFGWAFFALVFWAGEFSVGVVYVGDSFRLDAFGEDGPAALAALGGGHAFFQS